MDIASDGEAIVVELLEGSERFSAFGVTNLEVSMKNMSNRKITSIMAAKLNSGSTRWRRLRPILKEVNNEW
jgi:hypothetical protein